MNKGLIPERIKVLKKVNLDVLQFNEGKARVEEYREEVRPLYPDNLEKEKVSPFLKRLTFILP